MLDDSFPVFGRFLDWRRANVPDPEWVDEILPAASLAEIAALEEQLSLPLPASYKRFLAITRGVTLWGGELHMDNHPFLMEFPSWDSLTSRQRFNITRWPPPCQGMLCFAEYWLDGDGDQALFDIRGGLVDGEYPIYYYNHDQAEIRLLAPSFQEWLEQVATRWRVGG